MGATNLSTLLQTSTHPLPRPFVPAAKWGPGSLRPRAWAFGLFLPSSALLNEAARAWSGGGEIVGKAYFRNSRLDSSSEPKNHHSAQWKG